MQKLSSDFLFYHSFIGLILGPFLIYFFLSFFFANSFSNTALIFIYSGLTLFVIYQWYKVFKYKQVSYYNNRLLIKSYFSDASIELPFTNIISIEKALILAPKVARMSYKITFIYEKKTQSIFFYKALELYNVDDLANYIGLENKD